MTYTEERLNCLFLKTSKTSTKECYFTNENCKQPTLNFKHSIVTVFHAFKTGFCGISYK